MVKKIFGAYQGSITRRRNPKMPAPATSRRPSIFAPICRKRDKAGGAWFNCLQL
jgi:hypothetical protein